MIFAKKVIGNLEVERVTGIKNDDQIDEEIIRKIFHFYNVNVNDICGVAYGYSCNPYVTSPELYDLVIRETEQQLFGRTLRAFLAPHHLSHALSCAVASNHKRTLIITADGWGDNLNTCLFGVDKDLIPSKVKTLYAGYQHRAPAHI